MFRKSALAIATSLMTLSAFSGALAILNGAAGAGVQIA